MAESRSPRKPTRTSGTMRIETVRAKDRSWLRTSILVVAVALGGAAIGSLGSQLLARLTVQSSNRGAVHKAPLLLLKSNTPSGQLAEIDQALLVHDSATAIILCDEALRGSPGDPQLMARRKRAEEEQLDRFRLEMIEQAISRRNYAAAAALAEEISAASPQRVQATTRLQAVLVPFLDGLLAEADRAAKLSLCNEARALLSQVLQLHPQNGRAQEILASCPTNSTGG